MNVPACSATSNVFSRPGVAKSCQPNSQGTRMRCPLEEIGRNSDRPWVTPSAMAWTIGNGGGYRPLCPTQCHVADGERDAGRATWQPLEVAADDRDVEQHALEGRRHGGLADGLGQLAVADHEALDA